jgi:hypothetical protein
VTSSAADECVPPDDGFAPPATLGACADELYQLREQRLAAQKIVDALASQEARLREHVIHELEAQGATAVSGQLARAGVTFTQLGRVADWDKFYAHVLATKDFSLMQRRLNDGALRERWEAAETVPGVVPFAVPKISLTKVR